MTNYNERPDPIHVNQDIAAPVCFCGSPAVYHGDTIEYYNGKDYGPRWICSRFPVCRGSVGAHPDGRPLGSIADPETKKARMQVHALIDQIWKNESSGRARRRKRASVYRWLARLLNRREYHTGDLTAQECRELVILIMKNPYDKRHDHRAMRFTGADADHNYTTGEMYELKIETSRRTDGKGEKPTIVQPHLKHYDTWRAFYEQWSEENDA